MSVKQGIGDAEKIFWEAFGCGLIRLPAIKNEIIKRVGGSIKNRYI